MSLWTGRETITEKPRDYHNRHLEKEVFPAQRRGSMKNTFFQKLALGLAATGAILPISAFALEPSFQFTGKVDLVGGGEVISYTPHEFTLATTYDTGSSGTQAVNLYNFNAGGTAAFRATVDLSSLFGAINTFSITSVALDPAGRGFGVATIVPVANTTAVGKLAFFDYTAGFAGPSRLLHSVDVGYHPDSVRFSSTGDRLIIANEGEANVGTAVANDGSNALGSLSFVSLSGITMASQVTGIGNPGVLDFSSGNLAGSASLSGIRNPYINAVSTAAQTGNTAAQTTFVGAVPDFTQLANISIDVEPEYGVIHGTKAYVSLQENNAIAVVDLTGVNANKITAIHNLGTISQTIDTTDTGATANVAQNTVKGMPMPDTIAVVTIAGTDYIITANEGDARIDDRDVSRFGDVNGGDSMNPILDTNYPGGATGVRVNADLGRLNVSRIDGDTDNDGKIDEIRMFGTRSFSIWDAATGALVADSGSLEARLFALDPTRHNINREGTAIDNRSDDKGPEPEAITTFVSEGKTYVVVGLERQNGLMIYDVTNPLAPTFVDYVNGLDNGLVSPESLVYISSAQSPDGLAYLLGGFEGGDNAVSAGIGIYSVPEPTSAALLLGGAVLLGLRRRRA